MHKTNLKQGSLKWEAARSARIGSSEIFDIVKYYSTDDELQNCGINAEKFRTEDPYTTAWALYHKMRRDGIYEREGLKPELAEYGHAVEPYGLMALQQGRKAKLKPGAVYVSDRLIASLDIGGVSEEIDERPFDYGHGVVAKGKKFVCEQKTIMPNVLKSGLPLKYVLQAQYQTAMTKADFFILQIMVLENDTVFERGKITQMSRKKMFDYLRNRMSVTHLYFQNNEQLAMLIKACLDRFFSDVDNCREPTPFIPNDKQKNIINSIRLNTFYKEDFILDFDLAEYAEAKSECDTAEEKRRSALQKIIEAAKNHNACRFVSKDGRTASFSKDGKFLVKPPKE